MMGFVSKLLVYHLEYFQHIIPCGIHDEDKSVTSLQELLGQKVDMTEIKQKVVRHFGTVFECRVEGLGR